MSRHGKGFRGRQALLAFPVAALLGASLVACTAPAAPSASPSLSATEGATVSPTEPARSGQTVTLELGDRTVTAELFDNPTADDLASLLPLTTSVTDFNRVEKIAALPRALTTDGVPDGADPELGDLGYYAPDRVLVLYYGEVGYWSGIVRLGRLDADLEQIRAVADGTPLAVTSNP